MKKMTNSLLLTSVAFLLLFGTGCTHLHEIQVPVPLQTSQAGAQPVKLSTSSEVPMSGKYHLSFKYAGHTHNLDSDLTPEEMLARNVQHVMGAKGYDASETASGENTLHVTVERFNTRNVRAMWSLSLQTNITAKIEFKIGDKQETFEVAGFGKNVCQVFTPANFELSIQRALEDFSANLSKALEDKGI